MDDRLVKSLSLVPRHAMRWRLILTDVIATTAVALLAEIFRFGDDNLTMQDKSADLDYLARLCFLIFAWNACLRLFDSYDFRMLGHGPEEYRSVIKATFVLFATIAILSYALKLEVARGYVVVALPLGVLALVLSHWFWRQWLVRHRLHGRHSNATIVVGTRARASVLIRSLQIHAGAGYRVIGACVTDGADSGPIAGIPVLGPAEAAAAMARRENAATVVVASSPTTEGGLRNLAWQLEGSGTNLVVVPGLVDVAGPRVRTRPIDGHALLLIEQPVFTGPKLFAKTIFDRVGSAVILILLGPALLVLAFLVWRQDRGPVFFRQQRVGLNGHHFPMTKFRSMVVHAEQMRAEVAARESVRVVNKDSGPLFKVRDDPRITPLGRFLRKYSLDELPQLFDVLRGDMSLVGPRPPLPCEVAQYEVDVRRRLLVKPGMTGLWQINGRSELSWEESVRFDLYYVENWSIVSDLVILWRTGKAVFAGAGAY